MSHLILRFTSANARVTSPFPDMELHECDTCGAAVSDPELHAHWHESTRGKNS